MRDELRQSFALLPRRPDAGIGISKPSESSVKKFIRGRGATARALAVEGPAKTSCADRYCSTAMRRSQWLTSVDFPTPAQATIVTIIYG
jgi:hypothetical protein